jgi:RING finger and CHY zinc finger domain-containing protein 1
MHTSRLIKIVIRCGHAIHLECMNKYLETHYTCPVCKKSVLSPEELNQFIDFERDMQETQMPEEYRDKKMTILCNDCLNKSVVPFHILGG